MTSPSGRHIASPTGPLIRDARLPDDLAAVERLWLEYLTWRNDEMEALHGFRLPVEEAVARDLATIERYQPPDGRLILAVDGEHAYGIGCLHRIGPSAGEMKRMYVEPARRGVGAGRATFDGLLAAAAHAGYAIVRLDSPDFMTAAHGLYRSRGFGAVDPYTESGLGPVPAALGVHGADTRRMNNVDSGKGDRMPRVMASTPPGTPTPIGPYNHIARVGDSITVGATAGVDPATGQLAGSDIGAQTMQILDSFRVMLDSVDSDMEHIVHITVFLLHMSDFEAMNAAYAQRMGDHRPARTVIGVRELPKPGVLVTMNLTAVTRD